jgi:hypothetical protein
MLNYLFLSLFLISTCFSNAQADSKLVQTIITKADCTSPNGAYTTEIHSSSDGYLFFRQIADKDKSEYKAVVLNKEEAFDLKDGFTLGDKIPKEAIVMLQGHDFQRMALTPEFFFGTLKYEGKETFQSEKCKKYKGTDALGNPVSLFFNKKEQLSGLSFPNSLNPSETIEILFKEWGTSDYGQIVKKVEIIQAGKDVFTFNFTEVIFNSPLFEFINPESFIKAREILDKSIQFHDPDGKWASVKLKLKLQEPRVGNPKRYSIVSLDNTTQAFELQRNRDDHVSKHIIDKNGISKTLLDGKADFPEELVKKYRLDPARNTGYKNFNQMMYGLPMVFEGEKMGNIYALKETLFEGREVFAIDIELKTPIIEPIWRLLIAKEDYQLVGLQIFDPFEPEKGEELVFQDLMPLGNMQIPRTRHWIALNSNKKYLGSDIVLEASIVEDNTDYLALLESNEIQRRAHMTNDAALLVGEISDTMTSVQNGKVSISTNKEVRERFESYFSTVKYSKWDDLKPPIVTISEDGKMATVVFQKLTEAVHKDENGNWSEPSSTTFAWTSLYKKINGKWKIVSNTSTRVR